MRAAVLIAAFAGWGAVAALANAASPGVSFIFGLAIGAGAMLVGRN